MSSSRRIRTLLSGLVVASVVLAGCGLPQDTGANSVALPPALTSTTTTTSAVPPQDSTTRSIHLVKEGRLAPVERQIENPATPDKVWAQLLAGPTEEEASSGLRSSLPAGLEIVDSIITGDGVMVIDLSPNIDDIEGDALRQAAAQLVYTATEFSTVFGVQFRVTGAFKTLPLGDGTLPSVSEGLEPEPVERSDYRDFAPTVVGPP